MMKLYVNIPKRVLIMGGVLVIILFMLSVSVQQIAFAQSKNNTPAPNTDQASIKTLEKNLQNPNLDEDSKKMLRAKLEVYYHNATQEAKVLSRVTNIPNDPNRKKVPPPIPTIQASERMTGIIERPAVPFPSSAYQIENAWQEKVDDAYILVFAGADSKQSNKGVLVVMSDKNRRSETYYTPTNSGSVKITEVKGLQLVLKAKGNEIFYFDVLGRKFISSLDEVVPTITPIPNGENIALTPTDTPVPAYPAP